MTVEYSPRGLANLNSDQGRLRIRFPRSLFGGRLKFLALGLDDTPTNRVKAEKIIQSVNADIEFGRFDLSLERYKPYYRQKNHLKAVEELYPDISLIQLWNQYVNYKVSVVKENTINYYKSVIFPLIQRSNVSSPYQALELREWLTENTTESCTKRVLQQACAAFKWGLKHHLVKGVNPYLGMAGEFKHPYECNDPEPNAFSQAQKMQVLDVFKSHNGSWNKRGYYGGSKYSHYYPFVKFLFLTGCRPSEAIGLTWGQVNSKYIQFDRSITHFRGKKYCSSKSKNNRSRKFAIYPELRQLLEKIKPEEIEPSQLVFPAPKGGAINYSNFSQRAWKTLVDPIKADTTPYSCRDTFITEQVIEGVAPSIVAKWCDTSAGVIEKFYLDTEQIAHILPVWKK
jgi:integrase